MSFMEPEIHDKARVFKAETRYGTFYVPDSCVTPYASLRDGFTIDESSDPWMFGHLIKVIGDYVEGGPNAITSIQIVFCYLVRYQNPGYLDCTDWQFGTNKRELLRELRDAYGE